MEIQMICGPWKCMYEIGHGAYGTVYLAERRDGERVAVKLCRRDAVGDERYARELRGAKLYKAIPHHDGLVQMRELVETEWGFYAVMDLADDEFDRSNAPPESYRPKTLAKVIEGEKALPLKECVKLGIALAGGLAALQRHHLLHRDIKPGNVIYVGGKPVLSDPGLVVEETEAASLVGTPGYVPPEKFTDAASDIYSLGLTLKAASFGRTLEDLGKGPAIEADTGAALFPAWWRILNKATDPTPSHRYQSAKALVKDLKALRLKMAVTSKLGSRIAQAAVLAASIAVAAFVGVIVVNNGQMSKEVADQKNDIARQIKEVADQRAEIERQNREMTAQREQIERQNEKMSAQQKEFDRQSEAIAVQREQLERRSNEIASHREEIARQEATIKSQSKEIAGKADEIARQRDEIVKQRKEMDKRAQEVDRQAKEIADQVKEMALQRELMAMQQNEIDKKSQELAKQAKEISGQIEARSILTGNEANLVNELHSLRRFKSDIEANIEESKRHSQWGALIFHFGGQADLYKMEVEREIERVSATNETKGVELRSLLDAIMSLDKKNDERNKEISSLQEIAREKRKRGLSDEKEFEKASGLKKEIKGAEDEMRSIFNKIRASLGAYK